MTTELVFTVNGAKAEPARPISLAEAGLRERRDLQEWVIAHPQIIGSDVKVVGFEFNQWQSYDGSRELDRLDVLGIDEDGRLVVAELKRDKAPDTVHMQAIKYAAMASRFTGETLVATYQRYRTTSGDPIDDETALEELKDHAGELDVEQLRRPRIVLVAGSFPSTVTATVVWLTEMGLDIALQRVQAYRVFDERIIVTVSQLYPVVDVEEFTVGPTRTGGQATTGATRSKREGSSVVKLIRAGEIEDETEVTLQPVGVNQEVREAIDRWVAEDPRRGRALWHNNRRTPLEWEVDGSRWRPTPLAQRILAEVGVETSVRGPAWWTLPDGRDLATAAGDATRGAFDWTALHELLEAIPAGRWTTYGDVAKVIGTAAQPLGQHLTRCPDCPHAQRVLGADGRPRQGFSWGDPNDRRTQEEALIADGVRVVDGVADPSQRLDVRELGTGVDPGA